MARNDQVFEHQKWHSN